MDSSNTIKEFFENQGAKDGIEHNIRSGDSWSYLLRCPLDGGGPIALLIAGRVKLKARISSFFIGAGTFLLFAMLLEQQLHVLVIRFCGLNAQSRPWLYFVYAALAAAVLAYGIHFIVDFFAVAGPVLLPIYVIEIGVFAMATGTLVMALKMGRMEEL